MTIHQITFSPTGGTRRASEFLCKGFNAKSTITELCTQEENLNYPNIEADDLVVISMPVYAGRVPALAVERLKNVISNGAKCVIIAVYGNRAYEDALVEMQDVATEIGFQVIAAIAAIAEHSICRMYATGRPDDIDAKELASFGTTILEKIKENKPFAPLTLPAAVLISKVAQAPSLPLTIIVRIVEHAQVSVLQEPSLLIILKETTTSFA